MSLLLRSCRVIAFAVTAALALSAVARADEIAGDASAGAITPAPTSRVPAALGDMLQPLPPPLTTLSLPAAQDAAGLPHANSNPVALWQRLAALPRPDRANAAIEVELGAAAGPLERIAATRIRELWRSGRHDDAIAELQALESLGARSALGIAWTRPARPAGPLAAAGGGGDVRIGTRTSGRMTSLGYDPVTGALYAVIGWGATTGGEAYWTVNRSADDGATWAECYAWYAGATGGLIDMSATVVGGYVYVGYVPGDYASEYRLRRCLASTGASDAAYGWQTVANAGALAFRQVRLVSNALSSDNRVYCFAIQSDNAVRFFWAASSPGTTFTEVSPAGASASTGLDASWNPGYASYYLHVAYAGTDGLIHVQRASMTGWTDLTLLSSASVIHPRGVTISAHHDAVICAYEYGMTHGTGITYGISYTGGTTGSWDLYNYVFEPDGASIASYQCPVVDAQDGHGTAIIASAECGEPDRVFYRKRAGYAPGLWESASQFNDNDVTTGTPLALAHVPVLGPGCFSHGAIYFFGSVPYFDLPMLGTAGVPGGTVAGLRLSPPAPCPMAERATLRFTLPASGPARIELFDVRGGRVATLADGPMEAGAHTLALDGRGLGSGVYFCSLTAGAERRVSRFVVMH